MTTFKALTIAAALTLTPALANNCFCLPEITVSIESYIEDKKMRGPLIRNNIHSAIFVSYS